jgi:excisionase family DNA binding protein
MSTREEFYGRTEADQSAVSAAGLEREWLTYAEAGRMVGLSRVTLWKLICAGEVEAARIGRAVRINRESLTSYMKRSAANSATGRL